jgi:cytochrome b-561
LLAATALTVVLWAVFPLGGLSWSPQRDPSTGRVVSTSQLFNWHPVLMSLAFLLCAGEALLAYRSARPLPLVVVAAQSAASAPRPSRPERKAAHAALHGAALLLAILGSTAAWRSHSLADPPIPHMYSPHSWLGATAMTLFITQASLGVFCYVFPGLQPLERRALFSPWHRLLGLCAFFAAVVAIATGLQEKATFAQAFAKADVRGPVVRTAALAELGVLASAAAVGAAYYFSSSATAAAGGGGGGSGSYYGSSGREEEGLLPPRGSGGGD